MSESAKLLSSLQGKGVKLWVEDGRVRFRAAKGMLTDSDRAALQAMQREVMELLRQRPTQALHDTARANGRGHVMAPLTCQQRWLWEILQTGAQSYLDVFALNLLGPLRHDFLERSFATLVSRHASLRTRIARCDDTPTQRIAPAGPYELPVVDLSETAPDLRDARVQETCQQLAGQGCDLAVGPLFATRLIKLSAREHVLAWSIHHIISDGYSIDVMFRELWCCYRQLVEGGEPQLDDPPWQYPNYALWQQTLLHSQTERSDSYWRQHLQGAAGIRWPQRMLAVESSRRTYDGLSVALDRTTTDALRGLASRSGTTLGMAVLALCVVVISRWCQQSDITFATTVTGRDRAELESMTGYCAHAIYLRVQLQPNQTFVDLLGEVSREFYGALLHPDFGRSVAVRQHLCAHTLIQWFPWRFDAIPGLAHAEAMSDLGLSVRDIPVTVTLQKEHPFRQYDLLSAFWEGEGGVAGRVFCRPSMRAAVQDFVHDLRLIALEVAHDPAAAVSRRLAKI